MRATLTREWSGDLGTHGTLRLEGTEFKCHTGELPWRDNKPGLSCTKAGDYNLDLRNSAHFKRPLWHLEDRDGRVAEEIHNGNWSGDTTKGWRSDVQGCILLGYGIGDIKRPDGKYQKGVTESRVALDRFMELTRNETTMELSIVWKGINPEVKPEGDDDAVVQQSA